MVKGTILTSNLLLFTIHYLRADFLKTPRYQNVVIMSIYSRILPTAWLLHLIHNLADLAWADDAVTAAHAVFEVVESRCQSCEFGGATEKIIPQHWTGALECRANRHCGGLCELGARSFMSFMPCASNFTSK